MRGDPAGRREAKKFCAAGQEICFKERDHTGVRTNRGRGPSLSQFAHQFLKHRDPAEGTSAREVAQGLIAAATTGTDVLGRWVPLQELLVCATEVRDMLHQPHLEQFRKFRGLAPSRPIRSD